MGADLNGSARRTAVRAAAYAACGAVLLAGCATMPDSGDLRGVESTPRQDSQVRVFAMPPREGALPSEIVQGFLEALTSDDPTFATARQYLTPEASKNWHPFRSTTVLADGPGAEADRSGGREYGNDFLFTLTGTRVATVDEQQSYTPAPGMYRQPVHLTRDGKTGQWRIDGPPPGVVMGKSDFQRNYMSVNKYYFASSTQEPSGEPVTVADPVYVRERVEPMTQVVRSVLAGPTRWLRPVARSSFPTGTALEKGVTLTPDDQNRLTVPLNGKAARVGRGKCDEMAAQLLFTLQNLTPVVDEVELRSGGRHLCSLGKDRADTVAARGSQSHPQYLYFVNGDHRLVRLANGATRPDPVPGPLGEGGVGLSAVAVSHDEHVAAGVSADGRQLYVASMVSASSLGGSLLTSRGAKQQDRLSTPSWDPHGDLWVADRDPAHGGLFLLVNGAGKPMDVATPGLDGTIRDVRVAADGVRIALVVEKGGKQSLVIGRIERDDGDGGGKPQVSVLELRPAAPELEEVTTMSWAGDSRLVVVGRETEGVQQMRYVQVDGSTPEGPAPAALTGVQEIAASEDDRVSLVAHSVDGIVRLPATGQWEKVVKVGSAPVYPG
ncbi:MULTISPECIES: LpqB family beta-propeller domain-containing protein [unclassified Streptomyces]|uniref:LpqB family beta-propeller domain-containing protein n=1 Tax=unclassified Streptomyces TaxID=2593676 RepID=UPI001F03F880|nr:MULTISPECIES: LpqB family beta-propeller domain-containing protein [unclassified Streptomyces]MCH0566917.1 GerMN domain-containing protein [Streptomyces sp. MUM 2J]MCH0572519.1 GerMN domain-containing protein [Streptomyces sp. MUM 136J]